MPQVTNIYHREGGDKYFLNAVKFLVHPDY
jgi:hypothetical protein